ncbi:hypothetical protein MBEHAL_1006 [Halarchaeum acidiphilum MH1-52-1]|uniref:Uncharacterized protein n=1 Tax=Halarchaeum acidiphilum MH1-52-1 TaxID=1261545 RepID=U2YEK3_9EURY|nr:hypothetical protein MBEHAL_1006 [Halarchaeum acidiphilum MH1-52-1]
MCDPRPDGREGHAVASDPHDDAIARAQLRVVRPGETERGAFARAPRRVRRGVERAGRRAVEPPLTDERDGRLLAERATVDGDGDVEALDVERGTGAVDEVHRPVGGRAQSEDGGRRRREVGTGSGERGRDDPAERDAAREEDDGSDEWRDRASAFWHGRTVSPASVKNPHPHPHPRSRQTPRRRAYGAVTGYGKRFAIGDSTRN